MSQTSLLQGTLHLLVLRSLTLGPLHGMGIARRVEQVTKGAFRVKAGSLFPALHRMEQAGWLESYWGETDTKRRAKYYQLTRAGRRQLQEETNEWSRIAVAIGLALRNA